MEHTALVLGLATQDLTTLVARDLATDIVLDVELGLFAEGHTFFEVMSIGADEVFDGVVIAGRRQGASFGLAARVEEVTALARRNAKDLMALQQALDVVVLVDFFFSYDVGVNGQWVVRGESP